MSQVLQTSLNGTIEGDFFSQLNVLHHIFDPLCVCVLEGLHASIWIEVSIAIREENASLSEQKDWNHLELREYQKIAIMGEGMILQP